MSSESSGVESMDNPVHPQPNPGHPVPGGLNFEAAYTARLPRLSMTEAHRLVEQIRDRLAAGEVPALKTADTFDLEAYRSAFDAAQINAQATNAVYRQEAGG